MILFHLHYMNEALFILFVYIVYSILAAFFLYFEVCTFFLLIKDKICITICTLSFFINTAEF